MRRWVLAVLLLLASLWFGKLALFNWWAAGGPPTPYPGTYALRSNVFFALAFLAFVAFVIFVVKNIRRWRQQR
jgi:hypothetical protein